uniref:Uncharacterized protein n=1 Tax=Yoonia rhodophyticola TaxID=3137370 RepID=A0AAN0MC91_9RHOB
MASGPAQSAGGRVAMDAAQCAHILAGIGSEDGLVSAAGACGFDAVWDDRRTKHYDNSDPHRTYGVSGMGLAHCRLGRHRLDEHDLDHP